MANVIKSLIKIRWVAAAVAVIVICLVGTRVFHVWPSESTKPTPAGTTAKTTSKLPSAQGDFTGGDTKNDNRTPAADPNDSATDTGGSQPQQTPDSSTWTKSPDGSSIVVMSPAANSLFASGDIVYGTSTASTVNYELEDNVSGVIMQGQANVVGGKFSVKFSFSTTGTTGRINVFNQAADDTESNNVSVNVRFQ
ncbi:MAG: hypothetical protein WDN27_01925 [Candidatus Saccharibacteria bacterium]